MNNNISHKSVTNSPCTMLFFALLLCVYTSTHADAKTFPAPGWLNTTHIADEMIINGLSSQVEQFETDKTINELLNFYRNKWNGDASGKPGYRESRAAVWHIISKIDGQYLYTVQVRQSNTFLVTGYLAIANLKTVKKNIQNNAVVPQMSNSKIINDVTSRDPGTKGRSLMLTNKYTAKSNSTFYRGYYSDRGWENIMDANSGNSFVMAFKKRKMETHLVISQFGETTQIVMNIIDSI